MKNKIKPLTIFRLIMWISFFLMIIFLTFVIIAACTPFIFKDKQVVLIVLFAIFAIGFAITSVLSGNAISSQKRFINQLRIENKYTLGEDTLFYNLDAFKLRVDSLAHKRGYANKTRYVVAFTPTGLDVSL